MGGCGSPGDGHFTPKGWRERSQGWLSEKEHQQLCEPRMINSSVSFVEAQLRGHVCSLPGW